MKIKKTCSFDGCLRKHRAKGLCRAHYNQQAKGKDLTPLRVYEDKGSCIGPDCNSLVYCKNLCRPHYMQVWEGRPLRALNGFCDACGEWCELRSDHDHNCCPSGMKPRCGNCERGSTCDRCNMTLGNVKDDPIILLKLVEYLMKTKKENHEDLQNF